MVLTPVFPGSGHDLGLARVPDFVVSYRCDAWCCLQLKILSELDPTGSQ